MCVVWAVEPILHPKCLCHRPLCPEHPPPAPLSILLWQPSLGTVLGAHPRHCRGCLPLPGAPLLALGNFPRAGMEVL